MNTFDNIVTITMKQKMENPFNGEWIDKYDNTKEYQSGIILTKKRISKYLKKKKMPASYDGKIYAVTIRPRSVYKNYTVTVNSNNEYRDIEYSFQIPEFMLSIFELRNVTTKNIPKKICKSNFDINVNNPIGKICYIPFIDTDNRMDTIDVTCTDYQIDQTLMYPKTFPIFKVQMNRIDINMEKFIGSPVYSKEKNIIGLVAGFETTDSDIVFKVLPIYFAIKCFYYMTKKFKGFKYNENLFKNYDPETGFVSDFFIKKKISTSSGKSSFNKVIIPAGTIINKIDGQLLRINRFLEHPVLEVYNSDISGWVPIEFHVEFNNNGKTRLELENINEDIELRNVLEKYKECSDQDFYNPKYIGLMTTHDDKNYVHIKIDLTYFRLISPDYYESLVSFLCEDDDDKKIVEIDIDGKTISAMDSGAAIHFDRMKKMLSKN